MFLSNETNTLKTKLFMSKLYPTTTKLDFEIGHVNKPLTSKNTRNRTSIKAQ